jgi:uncharacterized protein
MNRSVLRERRSLIGGNHFLRRHTTGDNTPIMVQLRILPSCSRIAALLFAILLGCSSCGTAQRDGGEKAGELIDAVGREDAVTLDRLLKQGADPNAIREGGPTALVLACHMGNYVTVKLLLDRGADVNKQASDGVTPLITAANKGLAEIVRLLLSRKANPNATMNDGWTALMCAVDRNHRAVVQMLLDAGADANVQDRSHGTTALMVASTQGHSDMVADLLRHRADPGIKDRTGKTAADLASNEEIRLLFRSQGVPESR